MTDGCGFLNHAALHAIVKYLDYESLPAGVQGRIDGSKGFWILHREDQSPEPKIWIRTSQDKIRNSLFRSCSTGYLTCLVTVWTLALHSANSAEHHQCFLYGIPATLLERMLEEGLEKEVGPLLEWEKPYASAGLWDAINKLGNVSGSANPEIVSSFESRIGPSRT